MRCTVLGAAPGNRFPSAAAVPAARAPPGPAPPRKCRPRLDGGIGFVGSGVGTVEVFLGGTESFCGW